MNKILLTLSLFISAINAMEGKNYPQHSVFFPQCNKLVRGVIGLPEDGASNLEKYLRQEEKNDLSIFVYEGGCVSNIKEMINNELKKKGQNPKQIEINTQSDFNDTNVGIHGTMVACTVFQLCNDANICVKGISSKCKTQEATNKHNAAIKHLNDNKNAFKVFNCSRGPNVVGYFFDQIQITVIDLWRTFLDNNEGSVVVASLGNESLDLSSLGNDAKYCTSIQNFFNEKDANGVPYGNRIIYAADYLDHSNIFSDKSEIFSTLRDRTIFAPGKVPAILDGKLQNVEGTSFAAPIISASILRLVRLGKTPIEAADILLKTGKLSQDEVGYFNTNVFNVPRSNGENVIDGATLNYIPNKGVIFSGNKYIETDSVYNKTKQCIVNVNNPSMLNLKKAVISIANSKIQQISEYIKYRTFFCERIIEIKEILESDYLKGYSKNKHIVEETIYHSDYFNKIDTFLKVAIGNKKEFELENKIDDIRINDILFKVKSFEEEFGKNFGYILNHLSTIIPIEIDKKIAGKKVIGGIYGRLFNNRELGIKKSRKKVKSFLEELKKEEIEYIILNKKIDMFEKTQSMLQKCTEPILDDSDISNNNQVDLRKYIEEYQGL